MKKTIVSDQEHRLMMTASKRLKALTERLGKSSTFKNAITKKQVKFKTKLEMPAH